MGLADQTQLAATTNPHNLTGGIVEAMAGADVPRPVG